MSTDYTRISSTDKRTEFAKKSAPADRFIHSQERKNRKVGTANQPIFVNHFTAVTNNDYAQAGATVPMLLPNSAKLSISAPDREKARAAWEALKLEVDQIFTSEPTVFAGLPLSFDFVINE